MATSGTFTGSRGGGSTGPYLTLYWERTETDIPNNRSKIRLTLRLHANYRINFSANKTGKLHGSSFTYTRGASGTGSWVLHTRDVWVNHNSDGSKSQSFSANFNIAINWSGSRVNSLSVSGTANINTIPRASSLSAFSFSSSLQANSSVTINYTVDRKSGGFRHQIQLRDGSYTLETWDNVSSDGSSTLVLSSSKVNELLKRMSNTTSRTMTLRVATRSSSGGGFIGSAVSRNATVNIHSSVAPSASGISVSIAGSGTDKSIGKYVQGVSRVTASFNRSAGYGANISSSTITVSGGGDSQTINSNSGTTGRAVTGNGTYTITGRVRDSRGREDTVSTTIRVEYYKTPVIDNFNARRKQEKEEIVDLNYSGSYAPMGGLNPLTINIQRRTGGGSWTNVVSDSTTTSEIYSGSAQSAGNQVTLSYDFRLRVTDIFGNSADSIVTVSTQRVVLDIHKNEGVGIGKIRERGVLDVDGEAYVRGVLTTQIDSEGSALRIQSDLTNGHGYVGYFGSDDKRKGYVGFGSTDNNHFNIANEQSGGDIRFVTRTGQIRVDWDYVVEHGSNNNGIWIRFYDGTQICWRENFSVNGYISGNVLRSRWTYPAGFLNDSGQQNGRTAVFVTKNAYTDAAGLRDTSEGSLSNSSNNYADIYLMTRGADMQSGWSQGVRVLAIGRWK